jgi:hypothetical protein
MLSRRTCIPAKSTFIPAKVAFERAEAGDYLVKFVIALLLLGADRPQYSVY